MKDFNKPVRKSIFDWLDDRVMYKESIVPIHDQKQRKGYDNTNYIIINEVKSTSNDKFSGWSRLFYFNLEIVTKTQNTVSSEIVDEIAGNIFELMIPTVGAMPLPVPDDFNYINLRLEVDKYADFSLLDTQSLIKRYLTFAMQVDQKY